MDSISRHDFLDSINRIAGSVYDFHDRFGIPAISVNGSSDAAFDRLRTRLAYLVEESGEHSRGVNQGHRGDAWGGRVDTAFVAMGTLMELEDMGARACRSVAIKNDRKTHEPHTFDAGSGKLVKRQSRRA